MTAPALVFERVSKRYRPAQTGLRDVVASLRGHCSVAKTLALDDVTFEVAQGHSVAIIGDNGAGKTTALRIASRLTAPSAGEVRVRGRVAILASVTSGLHPELTGRENIELYGRILGIGSRLVRARFEDIVDFAGVEEALDRPLKHWSTGMQVRLGFSVSTHIEPDVLLVDEAISGGDVTFQDRCARRMRELRDQGCTLVIVSHAVTTIGQLCERAIRLEAGRVVDDGPSLEVVERYLKHAQRQASEGPPDGPFLGDGVDIVSVTVRAAGDGPVKAFVRAVDGATIRISYRAAHRIERPHFSIGLFDSVYGCVLLLTMLHEPGAPRAIEGEGFVDCELGPLPLRSRTYEIWASIRNASGNLELVTWRPVAQLTLSGDAALSAASRAYDSPLTVPHRWRVAPG